MGIRGLTGWIKWAATNTIQEPTWNEWKGKTIGVDILGFLYNAKARNQCPLLYIGTLIASCKVYGIRIVPIFDGKPPDEKKNALLQRSKVRQESDVRRLHLTAELAKIPMTDGQRSVIETEVKKLEKRTPYLTSEERDQAKQLFYACGIVSFNATGEADGVLAYFAKRGVFDAVMSNDLDLLARGVETLLVPEHASLPGSSSGFKQYTLSKILQTVGFSYTQFVEMCVLMGCDYTAGERSLPYKSAFWAIKYRGSIERTLETFEVANIAVYKKSIEILRGELETKETLMGEKQWEKWSAEPPNSEPETLVSLRKTVLEPLSEEEFRLLGLG